jgi:hypothetical protein
MHVQTVVLVVDLKEQWVPSQDHLHHQSLPFAKYSQVPSFCKSLPSPFVFLEWKQI